MAELCRRGGVLFLQLMATLEGEGDNGSGLKTLEPELSWRV